MSRQFLLAAKHYGGYMTRRTNLSLQSQLRYSATISSTMPASVPLKPLTGSKGHLEIRDLYMNIVLFKELIVLNFFYNSNCPIFPGLISR